MKGDHSGFFNSKSKIQNEFGCVTTYVVMYSCASGKRRYYNPTTATVI